MALCAGGLYHITVLHKLAIMLLKSAGATSEGTVSTVCLPGTVACYNLLGLYPSSQACRDSNGVPNRQGQQVYVLDKQAGK